jgi:ferrous iron transport protein A
MLAWVSARSWLTRSWSRRLPRPTGKLSWRIAVVLQSLTSVALGQKATVAEIKLPPESRPRLMEMGLIIGTPVEVVRFAPLGDPIEIKVRGYNLTLRKHEAEQIFVKPSE